MNDLFIQYFQSFVSLLDLVLMFQSFILIFPVLPGLFQAKTAKLMQSGHLVSCFFPFLFFLPRTLSTSLWKEGRVCQRACMIFVIYY